MSGILMPQAFAYHHVIGKYLSGLRKLDCVISNHFQSRVRDRAGERPVGRIRFGMSASGMARQIRDGRHQGGIQPDDVSMLQGLDEVACETCRAHMATLRVDMGTSIRSWVMWAKNRFECRCGNRGPNQSFDEGRIGRVKGVQIGVRFPFFKQ